MCPVSIVDYENLIKDPASLGLFRNLRRMNPIINVVPVVEVGRLVVSGQEWDTLPAMQFRDVNEQFTDDTGTTKPVEERLAVLGGSFKSDRLFDKLNDQMYRDPVQQQFDFWNKTIDRGVTDNFFNGDIDTQPKGFNGLYKRFGLTGGFPSASVISASGSTDSLKVHADAASAISFFEKLDEAIYTAGLSGLMVDGTPRGALFLNKTSYLGIQKAAKMTDFSIDQIDLLGYTWKSYAGIPLVDVGVKHDKSTDIILDTYDPGDGGNDSSRIYVCRFSTPDGDIDSPGADGLSLVQAGGYGVLGPEEYAEYRRWALQWVLGVCHIGDSYCTSVLEDFKMAAS
jgi:hypothetical protein